MLVKVMKEQFGSNHDRSLAIPHYTTAVSSSPPGVPNLPLVADEKRGQNDLLGASTSLDRNYCTRSLLVGTG